ncbi:TonB-dependent receptor [Allosphingosinicella deserti]|uniref:TonB-dependent receptor n=1 Tax=Allosphingosinicella deserti TaxID=2116704 RepID=A0A2P7QJE5_9SPHN|nr:TonB-dependent receptor [Sphingomonas deserti]PSJ38097.1 TonB-dependent receptor [Sphingomonas deserti]
MNKFTLLCATTALIVPGMAMAQSTGSIEVEEEIVVTGARDTNGVEGVIIPDSSKARTVLTQDIIARQTPGQTILDTINLVPGVSFQNNDPYGSAGGTLTIRGFSSDRISLTWDGFPLNDTGNYAIYSNQQFDPELIGQVNVNLGTTDVDSPTASAVGGTVNYVTRLPREELGAMLSASYGDYGYHRVFGVIDTGELTSFGTRAFFSASTARNDLPFNDIGRVYKQQYNARIYQPIGTNGDFISIAGHYNQNRNNFFGSVPLRTDTTGGRVVGPNSTNRFPITKDERFYTIGRCTIDTPQAGVSDVANSCGSTFDERYNPSNTGNARFNSRFSLTDQLIVTVDAAYQYTLANGGGTVVANEAVPTTGNLRGLVGYGSVPTTGTDLNGDGDIRDTVRLLAPSNTNTNRYLAITNLIYDINDDHRIRLSYTFDRGRHRQTGEIGFLEVGGNPEHFFGGLNTPILDANGAVVQKRDRLSYATLHQVAAEYRGKFLEDALTVNIGLRAPFFKRDLDQRCFATNASGGVFCTAESQAEVVANNPTYVAPREVTFKYDKLLPNVGFTYALTPEASLFANYAKGISVPSTDNLYNSLFFAPGTEGAQPSPETTDSFDLGVRYTNRLVQAQLAGWYTKFNNRLASSFDPELNETVYRNLGKVTKWGVDASVGVEPVKNLMLYAFGSYLHSEIEDDIAIGQQTINGQLVSYVAATAGNRESGAPKYTFGGRIQGSFGPLELGAQVKRTGKRYVYDTNLPVLAVVNGQTVEIYGAAAPAYTSVDANARFSLADMGLENTYFQLNVTNLFDVLSVGGFGGGLNQNITRNAAGVITGYGNAPNVQIGAPRAVSATLVIGF